LYYNFERNFAADFIRLKLNIILKNKKIVFDHPVTGTFLVLT